MADLRSDLQKRAPAILAAFTESEWHPESGGRGEFRLDLWDRRICLRCPEWTAFRLSTNEQVPEIDQVLLLYYFHTVDREPISGRWVSFSELPNGKFYNQAFQSYTGSELGRAFQDDLEGFKRAAEIAGGSADELGDASFRFQALPKVPLLVVYWLGDDDFAASAQVLFDASASHVLPTDAFAILGSMISRKIITARGKSFPELLSDDP